MSGLTSGYISSPRDLAHAATRPTGSGYGPKPIPIRCSGALYLNVNYGEPIPAGKCDSGVELDRIGGGLSDRRLKAWSTVPGTTAPMNQYMYLPSGAGSRRLTSAPPARPS